MEMTDYESLFITYPHIPEALLLTELVFKEDPNLVVAIQQALTTGFRTFDELVQKLKSLFFETSNQSNSIITRGKQQMDHEEYRNYLKGRLGLV